MKIRVYADIHMYHSNTDAIRYMKELSEIKNNLIHDPPHMLVFAGDLIDKMYNMDSMQLPHIFNFVNDIVTICENNGIIFRIIKGTVTHEGKFIEVLHEIYNNRPLVKAIYEPTIESLPIDGKTYKILWLPETYGNADEYAELEEDYLTKYVDMTFFHGTIKSVADRFHIQAPDQLATSFIWKDENFLKYNKYFVAGGHIHKSIDVDHKIFYVNSYSALNFSDVEQESNVKGYMEFYINGDNWDYKRFKNELAPKYKIIVIKDIDTLEYADVEDTIRNITNRIQPNEKIRLDIKGLSGSVANANINLIKTLIKNYDISIKSYVILKDVNEDVQDKPLNKSLSIVDMVIDEFNNQHGVILDRHVVEDILTVE